LLATMETPIPVKHTCGPLSAAVPVMGCPSRCPSPTWGERARAALGDVVGAKEGERPGRPGRLTRAARRGTPPHTRAPTAGGTASSERRGVEGRGDDMAPDGGRGRVLGRRPRARDGRSAVGTPAGPAQCVGPPPDSTGPGSLGSGSPAGSGSLFGPRALQAPPFVDPVPVLPIAMV